MSGPAGPEGTAGNGRKSLTKIKDEVKFYPHQLEGVRNLARKTSFLLADEMGGGKAQPVGTSVATPGGWRPIGALEPGDVICRPSGGTQTVLARHDRGQLDVARVTFSDGASTLCCWDHLWTVHDGVSGPASPDGGWLTLSTRELHSGDLSAPDGTPRLEIPLTRPLAGSSDAWASYLDPFTAGFTLAGGIIFDPKTDKATRVKIAKGRELIARQLLVPNSHLVIDQDGEAFIVNDEGYPSAMAEFATKLRTVGIHKQASKRTFPQDIRFADLPTRMRFFLGILAVAGAVDPLSGHCLAINLHHQLPQPVRAGITELIQLLGGLAVNHGHGLKVWWPTPLQLFSGTTVSTARPVREITRIAPAGMAKVACITVDDPEGLYVTEHGIVTHNSLQALAVAAIDMEMGEARKILIVCPATLKDNWATEIEEHSHFEASVIHGTKNVRLNQLDEFRSDPKVDIAIMNYEQIHSHLDDINAANLDIVIFDEAHYLKNNKSQRTKACHKISAHRSFLLTGSPMLNQPQELWGILHRINPEEFPSFWKFSQRFCVMGGFKAKQVTGVKNRLELLEILDRYMLRRKKTEMIKLPDKNFIPVHVPLSPLQQKLYREAESELQLMVPTQPEPLELENALTKILRLKQITGTPATLGFDDSSFKLDRCIEIVHQLIEDGEKVVVFTQFRGVLEAIRQRLLEPTVKGHPVIPTWMLSGDVKGADRVPAVKDWGRHPDPGVLLSMLQVGGVGLDFTAASNVIFVDKLYTPAMNDQAVDRLHRLSMNKTKQVNIYELLATKTVEDRVEKILARKRKMTDEVVDNTTFRKMVVAALHGEE